MHARAKFITVSTKQAVARKKAGLTLENEDEHEGEREEEGGESGLDYKIENVVATVVLDITENWQYHSDFSGLQFWAKKGHDDTEPLYKFNLSQEDLTFWQALARCIAYASFLSLNSD